MERRNKEPNIVPKSPIRFSMPEIVGRWRSRSGAPEVKICRNEGSKGGSYQVEFAYDIDTVIRRPVKQYWGIHYFDMYGWIRMTYDSERDVLSLSGYGDYYREEE